MAGGNDWCFLAADGCWLLAADCRQRLADACWLLVRAGWWLVEKFDVAAPSFLYMTELSGLLIWYGVFIEFMIFKTPKPCHNLWPNTLSYHVYAEMSTPQEATPML